MSPRTALSLTLVVALAAGAGGCATPHTTFAVTGPANSVGKVDRRFDAEKVDITLVRGTDFEAEMVPEMREDITKRLGELLEAPRNAPKAPATKLRIQPRPSSSGRTFDVTFETQVGDKTVLTSRTTPDLAEPGLEGASLAVGLGGGIGYGCGLGGMMLAAAVFGMPGLVVATVLTVLAPTAGIAASYLVGQSAEKTAMARAGTFMNELTMEHARRVERATRDAPVTVEEGPGAPPSFPASPNFSAPAPAGAVEWYVAVDGTHRGPLAVNQVRAMVEAGTITLDTLVWKKGMPEWIPLQKLNELKPPAKPPPLPPSEAKPPPLPPSPQPSPSPPPLPK